MRTRSGEDFTETNRQTKGNTMNRTVFKFATVIAGLVLADSNMLYAAGMAVAAVPTGPST
jgi:hypothetical protein